MKKIIGSVLMCAVLVGCAGRTPNPVMATQYGDRSKSCKTLEFEMGTAEGEMQRLLPKTDKTGSNVALGVAGAFFLVPWFFMDFKNAEQTEYEAYRQRYNSLAMLAMDKGCDVKPNNHPSVQEMKDAVEKSKAQTETNK